MTGPKQSDFIAELQRLHLAQLDASTLTDREYADHELALFLRLNALGRLQEWWDRKEVSS